MLYWYVRSVITDNSRLRWRDLWHFLPMILFFIASLPHLFIPWSEKIEIASKLIDDPAFIKEYKGNIFYGMFPAVSIFMSRPILVLGYTLWSAGFYIRHTLRNKELLILSHQLFMKKWVSVLLGSVFIWVFSHSLVIVETSMNRNMSLFLTMNVLQSLSGTGLAGLLISPFFFPTILYGLPRISKPELYLSTGVQAQQQLPGTEKMKTPTFESDYLHSIGRKADACMKEFQPYLQPDFSPAHFSAIIKIPVHHLAYYFREEKKQSFSEYRNQWRINHAKKLIKGGKANELTLEAIGLLSGFSNRNTFFTAFKKAEGITPGAFASQFHG
jgi:AraC-like DNA-binding protein